MMNFIKNVIALIVVCFLFSIIMGLGIFIIKTGFKELDVIKLSVTNFMFLYFTNPIVATSLTVAVNTFCNCVFFVCPLLIVIRSIYFLFLYSNKDME
jgi:hypothetical protein